MSRVQKRKNKRKPAKKPAKRISKQLIMTLVIVSLMVLSVFGIMLSGYNAQKERLDYNGYEFQRTAQGWMADIDGKIVQFNYHPTDLDELEIDKSVSDKLVNSKVIYITFNPNAKEVQTLELVRFEFENSFKEIFEIYTINGVTQESESYNLPNVACYNATALIPVVTVVASNTTKAEINHACITVEVTEYTAQAMKDKLLYMMLGIM